MKKIKLIGTMIGLAVMTFSCVGLLDQEPYSNYSADSFYKTKSHAKAGIYGMYNQLQTVVNENFCYWGEGRADNVRIKHTGEPAYLHNNQLTAGTSTSADWKALYTLISTANYAIANIPRIYDASDAEGNHLIGQARAIRALAYFYIVRVWGDAPFILEPYTSAGQDFFVTKTGKEIILKQIEDDLIFAADNCYERNNNATTDRATITKGGANGILTQVYMWQQKYAEAIASADKVIGSTLYSLPVSMTNWSLIFTAGYQAESVFEVGYNDTRTNQLRVLFATGNDAKYTPSLDFRNSFEAGDLRRDYIWDTSRADSEWGCMWKYLGRGKKDDVADLAKQSIIITRLADIILLKAEAMVRKSGAASADKDNALVLLTPIRTRAGLPALTQSAAESMYGSVEDAIMHERSIELCFEGHRWFDLVRTGKAISTMGPINGLSDPRNLVWPVAQSSLDKNPNLEQNEFYKK